MNVSMESSLSVGAGTVRARLREGTRDHHLRMEQVMDVARCADDVGAMRRLLRGAWGFYRPLEQALAGLAWSSVGLDFDARRKTAWIAADLRRLGAADPATEPAPGCPVRPAAVDDLATGFGVLYVLEGATLGGQLIARRLADGVFDGGTSRFFGGYGAGNGARWREFLQALERHCAAPHRAARALRGAAATFDAYAGWMAQALDAEPSR